MSLAGVKVESDTVSDQECHVMSRGDHVTMLQCYNVTSLDITTLYCLGTVFTVTYSPVSTVNIAVKKYHKKL